MSQKSSVLNLLKSCCYRWNIPFPSAGTIYGNNDAGARQLLHILYAVLEELRQAACWTQQKKIYTFSTSADRAYYPLPVDFWAMSPFTEWNNDQARRLVGPLSDADMTESLNGQIGAVSDFEYRLFGSDSNNYTLGGQFQIYPTPSDVVELSFEYLTSNLLLPKFWQGATNYTLGQYVSSNGNIYLCDTTGTSNISVPVSGTGSNITDNSTRWDYQNIAYETLLADTDIVLFEDSLVKLGVRAKWLGEKGEEWQAAETEFRQRIAKATAALRPSMIGSFSRRGVIAAPRGDRTGGFLT